MSLTNENGSGMVMPVGPMYGGGNGGRGGNSMRGYSGHGQDEMLNSLYTALDQATSEEERRSIKQLIDKIGC